MGNDGGSIPTRRELVKNAARAPTLSELKATVQESLTHAWTHCALSGEPLDLGNCVSDWRGRLYNYEAVLRSLMPADSEETEETEQQERPVQSLKDIVKLKLKRDEDKKAWVCPVSMKPFFGSANTTKAVYLVPCGHVFAEVAVKEIEDQERVCPECSEEFEKRDVIPVLPTTEEEARRLAERMEELAGLGLAHSLKKDKKAKKNGKKRRVDEANGDAEEDKKERKRNKKEKKVSRLDGINNSATANLTAKVLAEQDELARRRKLMAGKT